jgi:hypothetical protein
VLTEAVKGGPQHLIALEGVEEGGEPHSGSVPPGQKGSSTSTLTVFLSASNTASTCTDSIQRTIRMFERLHPPS